MSAAEGEGSVAFDANDLALVRELGRGATSTVYLGVMNSSGQQFAIKSIEKSQLGEKEWENLCREIEILRKLNHPNVIRMHSIFQSPQEYHIVLDYMAQGELFTQIVERGSFSESDAREIISQILEGLAYLHQNGIAHRDLKPENLLCSDHGTVVISDFGLSKYFERGQLLETRCGTMGYTAPEIVIGDPYTPKVDLWAVGVITYILLSGIAPFYGNEQEVFDQICKCEYDFPDEYFSHISDSAKEFISTMFQFADKRPSAEESLALRWMTRDEISTADMRNSKGLQEYLRNRRMSE